MFKSRILFGLAAAAGLVLAACGSDDSTLGRLGRTATSVGRDLAGPGPRGPGGRRDGVGEGRYLPARPDPGRRRRSDAVRLHQRHRGQEHLHRHVRRGVAAGASSTPTGPWPPASTPVSSAPSPAMTARCSSRPGSSRCTTSRATPVRAT